MRAGFALPPPAAKQGDFMKRYLGVILMTAYVCMLASLTRADDTAEVNAILDKAITALGGEEKLSKAKANSWKAIGKMRFGENESVMTIDVTMQGLDHSRRVFEGEFGGNQVRGVTVLAGDKGARKFGDNQSEMDAAAIANEKRAIYLAVVPLTVLPLKTKEFKVAPAGEEKVGDKPAVGVKATGPDGKDFTLYFDKQSGLPAKQVAKVTGFRGSDEYTQETTFSEFKEMGGIKKATKIVTKRDGQPFQELQITEFKVLDRVDPATFTKLD
jgi:hypothetical protein